MDGRIPRLWYLPEGWEAVSAPRPVADYFKSSVLLPNATSWPDVCGWEEIERSPHIFLSRSPLTFGHSQLVVPSPGDCEEDLFRLASQIIYCAISTFRDALADQKLHESEAFSALTEKTTTYGPYIKTLVLRGSADEKTKRAYKAHLVPYFASHASLCKKRYQYIHTVKPGCDDTGGLLGWLGEREDDVDRWEADSTHKKKLDQIANEHLGMTDLAQKLRELWPA